MKSIHLPLPSPATRRLAVHVTPAAERAIRAGHPWLFDGAIRRQSHDAQAGDLAVIFDRKDRFLAVGLYDPFSPIRVRVLQQGRPATIDREWFAARLATAAARRAQLAATATTGYRLVHGENDGLPGLVIDRYGSHAVLKLYTLAWLPHLNDLLVGLPPDVGEEGMVLRLSRAIQGQREALHGLRDGQPLAGPPPAGPVLFEEYGLWFEADLVQGQKTGFFLDQRENRRRVEALVAGDSQLRRVLNVFSYTGGFSLYAARGGATEVVSLDLSRPVLEAAARNFTLNQDTPTVAAARHEMLIGDAFTVLERLRAEGRTFDVVVVDPPSFARRASETNRALAAYGRLASASLAVLRPAGVLVMASCSSRVTAEMFFPAIHRAAQAAGRPLKELDRTGHPPDHPVGFPEGAYLKCLYAIAP